MSQEQTGCKICGDELNCNWYYGAYICEACKKFFYRSVTEIARKYTCNSNKTCQVTKSTRANCQYCRFVKCVQLGLDLNKKGSNFEINDIIQGMNCAVCQAKPTGIHFGVMTCEACKGFFRRSILNNHYQKYKCHSKPMGTCPVNSTRSCRFCRFEKCTQVGMSIENCKLGRTRNLVKQQLVISKASKNKIDVQDVLSDISNSNPSKKTKNDNYQESNGSSIFNFTLTEVAKNYQISRNVQLNSDQQTSDSVYSQENSNQSIPSAYDFNFYQNQPIFQFSTTQYSIDNSNEIFQFGSSNSLTDFQAFSNPYLNYL